MATNPAESLDVHAMIADSAPRPRGMWVWGFSLSILAVMLLGEFAASRQPNLAATIHGATGLATIALVVAAVVVAITAVRRQRAEQRAVAVLEERVQLNRWDEAIALLRQLLSSPMRLPVAWAQALLWLAMALIRFERFEDAIALHDHLLEHVPMDPATAHGVRLARAMAMLREDHLVDADRALSDLRRGGATAQSAGLALIEIYRDIRTGHPAEAIDIFESRRDLLRTQLSHRSADAWALAARGYDLIGRPADAAAAYENATLLSSPAELHRRYPELSSLEGKYAPATLPAGVA